MRLLKRISLVLVACATPLAFVGCDGGGPMECNGDVWIQVYSAYPEPLEISVQTFALMCDADPRIWVTGDMEPKHVAGDPEAGHTFKFVIENEGPLKGTSVTCNAHQRGIDLTYIRAEVTLLGEFLCECGTEEYFAEHALEECQ